MPLSSPRDFKTQVTRDAKTAGLFQYEVVQTLPTATAERHLSVLVVREVPGTSPSILYMCLADDESTTGYRWTRLGDGEGHIVIHGDEYQVTIAGATIDTNLTVHAEGANDLGEVMFERHTDTAAFGAHLLLARSRGDEDNETVVQSGDAIGRIVGIGHDGTDFAIAAEIRMTVDGTPGAGDMPGSIILLVTPDGAEIPVAAITISQDKSILFAGALSVPITTVTADPNPLTGAHHVVLCNATSGAFNITLPAASGLTGREYIIKKIDGGGNAVTVDGNASETIDGATTNALGSQYDAIHIICDGSNWHII